MIATPDRAFPALRVLLIGGLLAVALLPAPPCFAAAETDDPKESTDQAAPGAPQAPSGDPKPAGDGQATGPGAKSGAGQGTPTGGKKPAAARQKGQSTSTPATTPPAPKAAPAAPLRFDDDDLKAYRKPVVDEAPLDDPMTAPVRPAGVAAAPPAASGSPAAGRPAGASPPKPAAAAPAGQTVSGKPVPPPAKGSLQTSPTVTFAPSRPVLNPPKRKQPPAPPDPLAPFKQREAQEQFRAGQIQELRDRIGALQSRLDYLREKRTAVLAPLNFAQMPEGQTEEDRQKDASLRPKELLEQLEIEIASTEQKLAETRTTLAEIELRFGAEAGIR